MNIQEIIANLDAFDEELTIYAQKPWHTTSLGIIEKEPENGELPIKAKIGGYSYFLEIFVAKEFLEDYCNNVNPNASLIDRTNRIIEYAINDA